MEFRIIFLTVLLSAFLISSCSEEDNPLESNNDITARPGYNSLTSFDKTILEELNKRISRIESPSPESANLDLTPLDYFADKKIIALGEATHGTKEFFQMKHKIFKYLVEKHNYKVFGFEADMAECIYIDRFICKGTGTIEEAMNKMHFWTWKTQEVKELILWMREYNRTRSSQDQIHLLGFDSQYWNYNSDLLNDYLSNSGMTLPTHISKILSEIKELSSVTNTVSITSQYELFYSKCDTVKSYLDANKTQLIASTSETEFEQMRQLTIQAAQAIDVKTGRDFMKRDYYMAQNALWMSNLYGSNSKMVTWAHNGHINKGGDSPYLYPMGKFITNTIGDGYSAIGFSFGNGTFRAITRLANGSYSGLNIHSFSRVQDTKSYNFIFGFAKYDNFLLIKNNTSVSNQLTNFLNASNLFFSVGAVYGDNYNCYATISLAANYDAIIHLSMTNTAVGI